MCGRFASFLPPDAIRALFGTSGAPPNHAANYNVAPTQDAMVVRHHRPTGERRLDLLRWGLVPHFTTEPRAKRPAPINARSETAASIGLFKAALAARRCIVPADAFYEWQTRPDGKQPYAIARVDGAPLAFAGLWEGYRSPEGEILRTFCILTCAANAAMRALHERMPVLLERTAWSTWLGEDADAARDLLRPAPAEMLRLWPVSRAVNSVRNGGPGLLDVVTDPDAPPPSDAPAGPNPA